MKIIPVILCGGLGSRLWPLSTVDCPKPFHKFGMEQSLFQQTVMRGRASFLDGKPIIVGNLRHKSLIANQLQQSNCEGDLILEPVGRNSCAAIAIASLHALERQDDPVLLVMPSDQLVDTNAAFCEAVWAALDFAATHLITFGIKPASPHIGYGYISPGPVIDAGRAANCFAIEGFVEKPPLEKALQLMKSGALWNSGNFLFKARLFLDELERLQPEIYQKIVSVFDASHCRDSLRQLDGRLLMEVPAVSVDVAVFEKTDLGSVCVGQFSWTDIGNWDAAAVLYGADLDQNSFSGQVELVASKGNLVHSPDHRTALIGIDNIAVITSGDRILITRRDNAEAVGTLASGFQEASIFEDIASIQMPPQGDLNGAVIHDRRPWGEFQRIDAGDGYQVKRITVEPGQSLSLQSHHHRAEHWILVSGMGEVTIGNKVETFSKDRSVYIPKGSVHRLSNKGDCPLLLIEIQTGDYLGEDDIVRFEDIYGRIDT